MNILLLIRKYVYIIKSVGKKTVIKVCVVDRCVGKLLINVI